MRPDPKATSPTHLDSPNIPPLASELRTLGRAAVFGGLRDIGALAGGSGFCDADSFPILLVHIAGNFVVGPVDRPKLSKYYKIFAQSEIEASNYRGKAMLQLSAFYKCLILSLVSVCALLLVPAPASAQMSKQEKEHIASMISAEINRAIATHQTEGISLREKVVSRLMQCGGLYLTISKQVNDPDAKRRAGDAADISFDLSVLVSAGIAIEHFKEIANAAQKFIKDKFAAKRTPENEREMNLLASSCRSFNSLSDIPDAVASLLTTSAQRNEPGIEFAKELQECSIYYMLLAGELITELPHNSGHLSRADRDKFVKGMMYKTKSEQIEVLYKNLARLAGMTAKALASRGETMFENQKRLMGRDWNVGRLRKRYKAFCRYILSDAGGKARLQDIRRGNVCGGLYKCW